MMDNLIAPNDETSEMSLQSRAFRIALAYESSDEIAEGSFLQLFMAYQCACNTRIVRVSERKNSLQTPFSILSRENNCSNQLKQL